MKLKIGIEWFRTTNITGVSKIEKKIYGEWVPVDSKMYLSDLIEAAYIEGKRVARREISEKLGIL